MPALAKIYDMLDKSKIEFLGIVEEDHSGAVRNIIEQKGLAWPQIMNSKNNDILKLYGINKYPTTFLIAPDGRILMKDTCNFVNVLTELLMRGQLSKNEYDKILKDVYGMEIFLGEMSE